MSETIAAIATGGALSAIGIVRISGDGAIAASDRIFRAKSGVRLADAKNRHLYYGELSGTSGGLIDLCLCTVSRGPDSYTGEDTVEFHCHGSPVVLTEVLRELFSLGVRQALPGEFTKRAFLGGRMDLSQAEAVIDLIEAETPSAAMNAAGQLRGAVRTGLEPVYKTLLDVMAHFHAVIDYPDEDIDEFCMQNYISGLHGAEDILAAMLATHERGKVLRGGIPTAIIGRPNTGKSSLLNALLGYDRAIVTGIEGTTRDTIEEKALLGGLLLRLIDTAGLRKVDDTLEKLGVQRTLDALRNARLVFLVLDGSEPLRNEDFEAFGMIPPDIPCITVINKSDLSHIIKTEDIAGLGPGLGSEPGLGYGLGPGLGSGPGLGYGLVYCRVSALTGEGLDVLDAQVRKLFPEQVSPPSGEIITNLRQAQAITMAKESIQRALISIDELITPDAVLCEIESALSAIGEVTGNTMREDIVSRIFERFCVGK